MIHPGEHVAADPCGAGSGRGGRRQADRRTNQRMHHEPCRRQSRTHHRRQGRGCRSRAAAHRRRRECGPRGRAGCGWRGAGGRTRPRGPIRTPRRDAGERLGNALRLTLAEFGHLDLLVNNAGIANGSPIGDFPRALRQKTVEINLTGSFLGMKTVSIILASQGHGSIINISSVEGRRGSSRYWRPSAAGRFRVPTCRSSCSLPPVSPSTTDRAFLNDRLWIAQPQLPGQLASSTNLMRFHSAPGAA